MADGRLSASSVSSEAVSTEQREFSSEDIPDPTTYVSSLKTDELKAELNKRGLKRSGNKSVLIDRLRTAIQSQDHDEEPFERSSSTVDRDERETALSCANNKLTIEDLSSFIETKVKEVCRFEIENLKSEASASYANELVISLQNENKDLQDKLQELESHHIILKQEANALREENKSVTVAEVVVVLPCTFITSSNIKPDPISLIQILSSCVLKFKNPRPSHFLCQTGIDLRIHRLSFSISSRSFWERLKRKILNQIY